MDSGGGTYGAITAALPRLNMLELRTRTCQEVGGQAYMPLLNDGFSIAYRETQYGAPIRVFCLFVSTGLTRTTSSGSIGRIEGTTFSLATL